MTGRIVKLVPREFLVESAGKYYRSKSRGKLRKNDVKPIVGDIVDIDIDPENDEFAYIAKVHPRKNSLKRPAVANVTMLVVTFALKQPNPDIKLLDSLLIACEVRGIKPLICFNKADVVGSDEIANNMLARFSNTGYKILITGDDRRKNISDLIDNLSVGVNVFAGPSGVGKSTIINIVKPDANMETSAISEKLMRGKHTTRHSELFMVRDGIFVCDTPGFSNYQLDDLDVTKLLDYMPDLKPYSYDCKFRDCLHTVEPGCSIIKALDEKEINSERYQFYKTAVNDIKNKKKY